MQPIIGILMLDTKFERIPGDIGNPVSFSVPVAYQIVSGATVTRVVKERDPALLAPFIQAAKELQDKGVKMITTSCGFLALFQKEIGQALQVPFFASSLLQIPFVHAVAGGPIGVLTARKASLTARHFEAAGAAQIPLVVYGMDERKAFTSSIVEETHEVDPARIEAEMVEAAREMYEAHPDIRAIVLECTNMPPYKEAIQRAVPLPLFDIFTLSDFVLRSLP